MPLLLFILCMESFSRYIRKATYDHWWITTLSRKATLNISHLLYADNVIILSKCSPKGLQGISTLLHNFCSATGLQINFSKSQIIFSISTPPKQKKKCLFYLAYFEATSDLLYHSIRLLFEISKSKLFQYLLTRI